MSCVVNCYDFVRRIFPPVVGSFVSPAAQLICQKNNLSFVELVRPFCTSEDLRLRDPAGVDHTIKSLPIQIQDVNERPPQPMLARKFLNESVSNSVNDETVTVTSGHITVDTPTEVKWYYAWCDTFLRVQFPADHEFIKHLLGCMLVVSSADPPETLQNLLQSLQQMQATAPARLPKWFSPAVLKYYVLIHDKTDGNDENALTFFNQLKTAYGDAHCFFLEINSQTSHDGSKVDDYWVNFLINHGDTDGSDHGSSPHTPSEMGSISGMPSTVVADSDNKHLEVGQEVGETPGTVISHPLSPDIEYNHFGDEKRGGSQKLVNVNVWAGQNFHLQHGLCLTQKDIDNIKEMIQHFCSKALIPHVEKQIIYLSDAIANKKAMSRSIFNATKRLFGAPKPGQQGTTPVNSVIYTPDAPELQLRRLGDLCFMFSLYSSAYQAYHSAKRDFLADQAWLYYAGALEMAALSAYMQGGEVTKKTLEYMEDSILTYLNTRMPQFATRATILSAQCLKERELFGEAAKQYIRMTSEDSDLRSALLLEQASYCFLRNSKPRMGRKYAFHMVLAGHRYSKAGQKKHALRCYKQAFQVYEGKGWCLAEDHIHYTIGRLAGNLKQLSEGASSLAKLISSGHPQTALQQALYLKEYLQIQHEANLGESNKGLCILPIPLVEENSASVLINTVPAHSEAFLPDVSDDSVRWSRMEELAVTEAQGPPLIFKPSVHLYCKETVNNTHPVVVTNEPVFVQITVRNPTYLTLALNQVRLLWNFVTLDGKTIHNEEPTTVSESLVETDVVDLLQLEASTTQQVILKLVPLCPGKLNIIGMFYILSYIAPTGTDTQPPPSIPGQQLFIVRGPRVRTKTELTVAEDFRLQIQVIESFPLLQFQFPPIKQHWLCGEIEQSTISFRNIGNAPLKSLYLATSTPHLFALPDASIQKKKIIKESHGFDSQRTGYMIVQLKLEKELLPGGTLKLPLFIRASDKRGSTQLELLFLYESSLNSSTPRHRVLRHKSHLELHDAVQVSGTVNRSAKVSSNEALNITLTIKNLNQIHDSIAAEVKLVQISMVSKEWVLNNKSVHHKDLQLQSQESSLMFLLADRDDKEAAEITDIYLCSEQVPSLKIHPYNNFFQWHSTYQNKEEEEDLDIILAARWKADVTNVNSVKSTVIGQNHISLKKLGKTFIWPPEQPKTTALLHYIGPLKIFGLEKNVEGRKRISTNFKLENAVLVGLHHNKNIKHDFSVYRICSCIVDLILKNSSEEVIQINVNPPIKPANSSKTLYSPQSSSSFAWITRSNVHLTLEPRQTKTIQLTAAFVAPGTYELGSLLHVTAATSSSQFVNQNCKVQSSIIVSNELS